MNKLTQNILHGITETSLFPLYGRAIDYQSKHSLLKDKVAAQIFSKITFDYQDTLNKMCGITHAYWITRAWHLDKLIKKFIEKHPHATIINLGAGLETAFSRNDNGQIHWVNIDLPDIIQLRKQWLPTNQRETNIAKSIFDINWQTDLTVKSKHVMFVACGLLMYFPTQQVKKFLIKLANNFPQTEMIMDVFSKKSIEIANRITANTDMEHASLHWGINQATELSNYHKCIQVLAQIPCFQGVKHRYLKNPWLCLQLFLQQLLNRNYYVHLKFLGDD